MLVLKYRVRIAQSSLLQGQNQSEALKLNCKATVKYQMMEKIRREQRSEQMVRDMWKTSPEAQPHMIVCYIPVIF